MPMPIPPDPALSPNNSDNQMEIENQVKHNNKKKRADSNSEDPEPGTNKKPKTSKSAHSSVTWKSDLDVSIHNTQIPSEELHSQLTSSGNAIKNSVAEQKVKLDKSCDPTPNFLMVNIGYALSAPAKNGELFISFPLRIMGSNYYNVQDSFESSGITKEDSVASIEERHKAGMDITTQKNGFTKTQKLGPQHYHDTHTRTYNNKFHHSEQALYEYLAQENTAKELVQRIKYAGVPEGTNIQAIVLDMHSTRYVCGNCEIGAQGIMSPEYNFLQSFSQQAETLGYSYKPDKDPIAFRVTANRPDGVKGIKTEEDHSYDICKLTHGSREIIEKAANVRPAYEMESDLHRRTVFISSHVSDNKKFVEGYNQAVVSEYTGMIDKGMRERVYNEDLKSLGLSEEDINAFKALISLAVIEEAKAVHETRTEFENAAKTLPPNIKGR